jgi:hypothetical protein
MIIIRGLWRNQRANIASIRIKDVNRYVSRNLVSNPTPFSAIIRWRPVMLLIKIYLSHPSRFFESYSILLFRRMIQYSILVHAFM